MNEEVDADAKKELYNTSGVGKINNHCEDVYSHTHRFHPLSKVVIHTSVQYGCAEVWMTILESGWNLWVWLVGVVSRRWVWLVVRRYIDILTMIINFPYSTSINSFFGICIPTSSFILKMFFRSFIL